MKLRIDCGRGTYIRAIARDLGEMLKTGGYLTELRRTRIGAFDIADAVTLERLDQDGVSPASAGGCAVRMFCGIYGRSGRGL